MSRIDRAAYLMFLSVLVMVACQASPAPAEPLVETVVVTEVAEATPVEVVQVVTPTPEPAGPRTLVVCFTNLPEVLSPLGDGGLVNEFILESIYDGPINENSFSYQPVLLEKLPSLADGDAVLQVVTVSEGDLVVDARGGIITLDSNSDPPVMLIPAGGGEGTPYLGGDFDIDQLTATFSLKPGLMWSDGAPLTVHDSVYRYNLQSDPNYPYHNSTIERTAEYEAIDDLIVQWTGLPGYLDPAYQTNFFSPAPEHLWGDLPAKDLIVSEIFTQTPIGWGPYIINEFLPGKSISLEKNPNYFRAAEGLPRFDTLIHRAVGENINSNVAALLSGECDVVSTALDDQLELVLELNATGQLKASFAIGTIWELIAFGIQRHEYDDGYQVEVDRPDYFSDVRTRQAFAMCMDRQGLVDTIYFGQSIVLDSYVPPRHPFYNPDVPHYEFDPQAGGALLEDVGWIDEDGDPDTPRVAQGIPNVPDGTPLEVSYETTSAPIRQQITAMLKDSLAQCGIKANVKHYSSDEWFADPPERRLIGRRFDLGQLAWITGSEDICVYWSSHAVPGPAGETWTSIQDGVERTFDTNGWYAPNYSGFANQDYDRKCGVAFNSLPGQLEYETARIETQRVFAEQLPVVPLFSRLRLAVARSDMCGLIMDPTGGEFWNIEEFDYGEGCED